MTRLEYFIERVLILKHVTPSMNEPKIVTFLCEFLIDHFDTLI